jgi:GTPase SAR1 family protein
MDVRLKHPFTCTVAGPSSSGKTWFVFRLIKHVDRLIVSAPEKILYCYGEFQPSFSEFPEVEFHEGLPEVSRFDGQHRVLLIIDDLMNETDQNVCNLFTKLSHHRNVSVVFITQNLYHRNRFVRTMNLNTHYIVLFKNPRDAN